MKKIFLTLFIFTSLNIFAQKPCEIDTEFTDSLGTYKSLKQQLVFEREFAGNSNRIYFTLSVNNGILSLETEAIQQSSDFIKAVCFDKKSKIYLQLSNGKIITLFYIGVETCGALVRNEEGLNNRIMTGTFVFSKENFDDLKTSKITFMRMQFAGETIDYPFKTSFTSVFDKKIHEPENYFINNLKCID